MTSLSQVFSAILERRQLVSDSGQPLVRGAWLPGKHLETRYVAWCLVSLVSLPYSPHRFARLALFYSGLASVGQLVKGLSPEQMVPPAGELC